MNKPYHLYIREKRKELGLDQDEMAKMLKISKSILSNFECGYRRFNDFNKYRFEKFFIEYEMFMIRLHNGIDECRKLTNRKGDDVRE